MSDKDVTRNVRVSGEEGIDTSAQRHLHSVSEKGNPTYDKKAKAHDAKRQALLARFREREIQARDASASSETAQDVQGPDMDDTSNEGDRS